MFGSLPKFCCPGKEIWDELDRSSCLSEIMRRIKLRAKPEYLLLQKHTYRDCTRHEHQTFIQAFIRFCNSYGIPSYIYSDNARSFDNSLSKDMMEHHLGSNEFRNNFISHTINHIKYPCTPHGWQAYGKE